MGELFDFVIHEPRAVVGVVYGGGGGISLKRYIASGENKKQGNGIVIVYQTKPS